MYVLQDTLTVVLHVLTVLFYCSEGKGHHVRGRSEPRRLPLQRHHLWPEASQARARTKAWLRLGWPAQLVCFVTSCHRAFFAFQLDFGFSWCFTRPALSYPASPTSPSFPSRTTIRNLHRISAYLEPIPFSYLGVFFCSSAFSFPVRSSRDPDAGDLAGVRISKYYSCRFSGAAV